MAMVVIRMNLKAADSQEGLKWKHFPVCRNCWISLVAES